MCVCACVCMHLCVHRSLVSVYYLTSFFLSTETAFSCDLEKGKLKNRKDTEVYFRVEIY